MKICLTGSHGTGKSTILKVLQEKLPGYTFQISSPTREAVGKDSTKLNFGTTEESQKLIAAKVIDLVEKASQNYVTTRSLIDVLAYTIYFSKVNEENFPTGDFIAKQFELVEKHKKDFDIYFYLPIEFDIPEIELGKEFREGQENKDYHKTIDIILQFLLWTFDIPYIVIKGTVEERVEKILKILGKENE